jgi:parvulin-like peptidyl-prolyl isomerase
MIKNIPVKCRILAGSAALILSFGLVLPAVAAREQNVVAEVGRIPITKLEVAREAERILPLFGGFHGGVSREKREEIKKKALENLIEWTLKVSYAREQGITVPDSVVEESFQKAKSRFQSEEDFRRAVGGDVSGFRTSLYRQLVAKKAEELAVDSKVNIGEEDVRGYYEENRNRFMRPKQFKASHILVKVDPAASKEEREMLKKKAEELAKRAKAGEDFYNLAYYNSDDRTKYVGGDLGYFHEGQTVKEFEDALSEMKVGEIAGPVKTLYGYHIIKLVEVNEAHQMTYEESKGMIRKTLEKNHREAIYREWMSSLREKYAVKRFVK